MVKRNAGRGVLLYKAASEGKVGSSWSLGWWVLYSFVPKGGNEDARKAKTIPPRGGVWGGDESGPTNFLVTG